MATYNRRGLWFDGCHYLELSGLRLNTSFTITAWTRSKTMGSLFQISRGTPTAAYTEQFVNWFLVNSGKIF
jgi:hypothetical protein